jgi:hypothetical protein
MQEAIRRIRVADASAIDIYASRPAGQGCVKACEILRAAIQPVVGHTDDSMDFLSAGRAPAQQVSDQAIELRSHHPGLGCADTVVRIHGNDSATPLSRDALIDTQLIANALSVPSSVLGGTGVRHNRRDASVPICCKVHQEPPFSNTVPYIRKNDR